MVAQTTLLALIATTLPLVNSQTCTGQSCILADVSGSSGLPYTASKEPVFPTQGMECCILHYNPNPATAARLYQQVPGLEASCATASILQPMAAPAPSCKPKVLIFAAGTSQPTDGGGPLGMELQSDLNSIAPGQWEVQGVPYPNTQEGNICVALPGGVTGSQMIANYVMQCPESALFVGGYSQGAMAAHDAVGNSTYASRINAVVTFGDPMNGAPIRGYSGPIHTTCHTGDNVCGGYPDVGPQHLNYDMNTGEVAAYLNGINVANASASSSAMPGVVAGAMTSQSASGSAVGSAASSTMESMATASASSMQSSMMASSMAAASSSAMSARTTSARTTSAAAMATNAAMTTAAAATTTPAAATGSGGKIQLTVVGSLIGPALICLLLIHI